MGYSCPAKIATLMVLIVLAAPPSARRTEHVWAEERAQTIPAEPVNTSSTTGEDHDEIQICSVAAADQQPTRREPPPPPRVRHAAGRAVVPGVQPREGAVASLMAAILSWIAEASDSSIPGTLPEVVAMAQGDFDLYLCEQTQMEPCSSPTPHAKVLAFFDLESQVIYIVAGFDPGDVEHQSTMVHELVHFLQAPARRGGGCRGVFAQEARQVTNRWRAARGLPAWSISPFEMLFQSCVPGWTWDQRPDRSRRGGPEWSARSGGAKLHRHDSQPLLHSVLRFDAVGGPDRF